MDELANEAREAYKKFIKSSKNIFGFNKKRENLKSFSEIQKEQNAYNSVYLGIREVELSKIVGSVEKFEDFDKNFVPKNNIVRQRWESIYKAYMLDEMLPTVNLYKIKDNYYVYDGNHRISVAKYLNFAKIEAEVEEFLPTIDKKEEVVYRENMIFEKETGIQNILFSEPIRYKYLKNEIENFCNEYGKSTKYWYKNIYESITNIIKNNNILEEYPSNNINDIFYYYLEHKKYLNKIFDKKIGYKYSLIYFINLVKTQKDMNIERVCNILENKNNFEKLDKIEKNISNENKKIEEKILEIFENKVKKMSKKYKNIWLNLVENEKIVEYIYKYNEIRNKNGLEKIENNFEIELIILNYIVEIFVPAIEILNKEEKYFEKYDEIQKQFFYLLNIEKQLLCEGKNIEFEEIIEKYGYKANLYNFDVKKIILEEKNEEFFENIKDKKQFLEIIEKYGNIKLYETYVKLFEWLDNYGEEKMFQKLKKGLDETRNSDELINFKTEKVLAKLEELENFGFVDYYVKTLKNNRN